jgi:hypothetical protein
MAETPPPHVAAAAEIVRQYLDGPPTVRSADEVAKMTPAQKLDYSRQFKQALADGKRQDHATMPEWKDPRR